jgi:hypothetical protein
MSLPTTSSRWPPSAPLASLRRTPVSRRVEATPCPSFAMVCLERVRVTGCFPRDRGRKACLSTAARQAHAAFGRPVSTLGPMESAKALAFTAISARPGSGQSWQACMEAGSHPVKNSVFSRQLRDSEFPSPRRMSCACDLWPECCTFFGQTGGRAWPAAGGRKLRPGSNRPGLQLDNKEPTSWR